MVDDKFLLKVIDLSKIFWGIDNLAEKCYEKHHKTLLEQMHLHSKLDIIEVNLLFNSFIQFIRKLIFFYFLLKGVYFKKSKDS